MTTHPETAFLTRFALGACPPDERRQVVRHLLTGCSRCSATIRDSLPAQAPPLQELLDELSQHPRRRQIQVVRGSGAYHRPDLVRRLIELSLQSLHSDARAVRHYAQLAQEAADRLPATGSAERADLRASARGYHGNALRILGRLREADAILREAEALLPQGSGDRRLLAALLRQRATLLSHQRKFAEAVARVSEARRIYRELREQENEGLCLLKEAIYRGYAGEAETALQLIFASMRQIERDPELARQAVQAAARFSIDVGRPDLGLALLLESTNLFDGAGRLVRLRRIWLAGELGHALGRLEAAESDLLQAGQGFARAGMPYEVALISLEVGLIYTKRGQVRELVALAAKMVPIFKALRVRRETLAALLLLENAGMEAARSVLLKAAKELRRKSAPGFS